MNGNGSIADNDEGALFYIVRFKSVTYTHQEDVESDVNKLASGELVYNAIYTSPGRQKSRFYIKPCKGQKNVTVSMNRIAIPNLDVKV